MILPNFTKSDAQPANSSRSPTDQDKHYQMPIKNQLICRLTEEEINLADTRIREDFKNDSHYFRCGSEYDTGNTDKILSRLPLRPGALITNVLTCNAMTTLLMYNDEFATFEESWKNFQRENQLAVPNLFSQELIIGLHSTTGMKLLNEAGYLSRHTSGSGHFALLHLNIGTSETRIFDSLGDPFDQSSYFLSDKIKKVITGLHDQLRQYQNEEKRCIHWLQPKLKAQVGPDCGAHMLANAELLAQGLDPSIQDFDSQVMKMIRRYHVLLKDDEIGDFRIQYSN